MQFYNSGKGGLFGAGLYFSSDIRKTDEFVFGERHEGCKEHKTWNCTKCDRHALVCMVNLGRAIYIGSPIVDRQWGHPPAGYNG